MGNLSDAQLKFLNSISLISNINFQTILIYVKNKFII